MQALPAGDAKRDPMGFAEFILLVALLISITALSIDIMLPALPAIGEALGVDDENRRQAVIILFLAGFGSGQLLFGPLADRFGRKPPLIIGLALCAVASLVCAFSPDFEVLLVARCIQGVACAGPRVVVIAVVRDRFSGRSMARVMSLAMSVFIMVPVIAPALGEGILLVANWRWIFVVIAAIAIILIGWSALRLEETLLPERRLPLAPGRIMRAFGEAAATRQTLGYGCATGLTLGSLYAYLACSQQIFVGIYDLGSLFPLAFGVVAGTMAIAFYANSRLVMRYGTHLVSHGAACGMAVMSIVFVLFGALGQPSLAVFMVAMSCYTFFFGLMIPNFNAMAMEPQGHIAGTASAFLGFGTIMGGSIIGWMVGQAFDGTVMPLAYSLLALSLLAVLVVAVTERGRLFGAQAE